MKKIILVLGVIIFLVSCKKDANVSTRQINNEQENDAAVLRPKEGYNSDFNFKRPIQNQGKPSQGTINLTWTAISASQIQLNFTTTGTVALPLRVYKNQIYDTSSYTSPIIRGGLAAATTYNYQLISADSKVSSNIVSATTQVGGGTGVGGVLLLVFDGITINGTSWNFNNQTFANSGLTIDQINWIVDSTQRSYNAVAQNITVTTDRNIYNSFDQYHRQMTIETTDFAWYCGSSTPCAGGVSIRNSFSDGTGSPNFVFTSALYYDQSYIQRASTHEIGHAFGLPHDTCGANYGFSGNWMGGSYGVRGFFDKRIDATCTLEDQPAIIRGKL